MSAIRLGPFLATLIALSFTLTFIGENPEGDPGDAPAGEQPGETASPPDRIFCVAFSPRGDFLAFGGHAEPVCLWDVRAGRIRRFLVSDKDYEFLGSDDWADKAYWIQSVAYSPTGYLLASGDGEGTIQFWDPATGREVRRIKERGGLYAPAFSPDGKELASVSGWDGTICLIDVTTGKVRRRIYSRQPVGDSIAFSRDGKSLAAAGRHEPIIWLWDAATGREVRPFRGHEKTINCVAFSPDGTMLASGSWDGTIRLWDVSTGKELARLEGSQGAVNALAFSPTGRVLASGGEDATILLWEVPAGKKGLRLGEPGPLEGVIGHGVSSLAFSPDRKILAAGMNHFSRYGDRALVLWDVATGRERASNP